MITRINYYQTYAKGIFMKKTLIVFCFFLIICMIIFPEESYIAAQRGLTLWWDVIIPALLPFFIIAELLLASHAVYYLGYALEPLMGPVFRLPGAAALALVMGYSSGFPTGAAITAGLREQRLVTKEEGERLISFTNNASPLFISVSVATSILHAPQTGVLLMLIHYGSNLLLGFLLRFRAANKKYRYIKKSFTTSTEILPPIGVLLKKAAYKAGSNIAIIGCYLVFFSVLTSVLQSCGLMVFLGNLIPLKASVYDALSLGFWEMTLGINAIGDQTGNLQITIPICAALMAWGGISVQAQVSAMVSHTDIRIKTYLVTRIIHAALSFFLAAVVCSLAPQVISAISISTPNIDHTTFTVPVRYFIIPSCIMILLTIIGYLKYKIRL
jgi:sporulation integral membrane protein YlbJ